MPDRLRLAMPVDLAGLQADVRRLAGAEWVAHFNTRQYEGDWSGVALRSPGGQSGRLYPDLTEKLSWQDTAELAQCPAVVALVALLGCPVTSLRFLQLAPLAVITAHRDHSCAWRTARSGCTCRSSPTLTWSSSSRGSGW